MSPAPGHVLHRICPSCDIEIPDVRSSCPTCGTKLVEIRAEPDNLVGTVIDGRFEIRDKLGQGGMGTVYTAWQRSVGREVAIKLIEGSYSRDPMAVRRFLREARLASQLSQPNTVSVFDFGQADDGRLFIAMELIRGRTLYKVVQAEGPFSVERAIRVGVQMCDALEAAHGLGIIHRDLKLENVILLDHPPGRDLIKVLDFGLAKNIREPGSRATESGIVVGTPRYMSPEAAMTGLSLPAGDLYALGVILGELTTGKPLWDGDSLPMLVSQKLAPAPALERVPPRLRRALTKLLDPEPDRRPTAEQTRALLTTAAEPSAGETMLDPPERETANLRSQSEPDAGPEATRQLTPGKIAAARRQGPVARQATGPAAPAPALASSAASMGVASSVSMAAASLELAPSRSRRAPVIAVLAIAAVAIVVAVIVATRGDPSRTGAASPADAAMAMATPDAAAPLADAAAVAPEATTVVLHIVSRPVGATVTIGSITKTTPFDAIVPRGDQPIELRAHLAGHRDTKATATPDRDQPVSIALPRVAASPTERPPF